jgi:hypothetical protein
MQLIPFTNRHSRFANNVDAFVDGELHRQALQGFQDHLGGCGRCAAAVADARALKASFASLPQGGAPRSFALTPEMAASEARERLPVLVTTPVYLTVARAAAVVSVVAFVAVFTLSVVSGDSGSADQQPTSGSAERNAVPQAADAAGGAAAATSPAQSTSDYAVGSPTVLLAPATSGAVSGAGAPSSTPAPPATGAQPTPFASQQDDASAVPKSTGPGAEALGDANTFEPSAASSKEDDSSGIPWTILTGCVAGVFVGILLVVESRRRRA